MTERNCFWTRCSDRRRCEAFGSCVALAQKAALADFPHAEPSPVAPSAEYRRGWDDCYARVKKVLGEKFTEPARGDGERMQEKKDG